ncbi:hypothetical protein BOH72_14015 [Mycobacterium sp. WY10]|nr:hypothetical protein BOH72_14015 [Mycobacterium sp. WY10]
MVILRGASDQILATGTLRENGGNDQADLCDLRFDLKHVPSGEIAYKLTVGKSGTLVLSPGVVKCGGTLVLIVRSTFEKVTQADEVLRASCSNEKLSEG